MIIIKVFIDLLIVIYNKKIFISHHKYTGELATLKLFRSESNVGIYQKKFKIKHALFSTKHSQSLVITIICQIWQIIVITGLAVAKLRNITTSESWILGFRLKLWPSYQFKAPEFGKFKPLCDNIRHRIRLKNLNSAIKWPAITIICRIQCF